MRSTRRMCLHLEVHYALDNYSHSVGSVAAGDARQCRWLVDSPVARGCGNSVDLQPAERPPARLRETQPVPHCSKAKNEETDVQVRDLL